MPKQKQPLAIRTIRNYVFIAIGSMSLLLAIVGIFVPLLPTTPLLLLSAALYFRSSERMYNWLLQQKHLGPYIRNFRENRAIPLQAKVISITLIWLTLLYCAFCAKDCWWLALLFILLATGITCYILSFKTAKRNH